MPESKVVNIKVVFQDSFVLKELYKFIYLWLGENGYISGKTALSSEKDLEHSYSEQDRDGVKEYHIWWRCFKQPLNPYFRYKLEINYLGLGIKNTEVIIGEKKYKAQIGEITISLIGSLITEANDSKGAWNKNFILKFIRPWYVKRWYRAKIEQHEDDLYSEIYQLQRAIKEFLELKQYGSLDNDIFFNKKGF